MADITVTVAEVVPDYTAGTPPDLETRIAGETILEGQPLYPNNAQLDYRGRGKMYKCDANAAATALCYGISLNAALAGQTVTVQKAGSIKLGASGGSVLTVGLTYHVSATAGGIAPSADVTTATDMFPCPLGVADTVQILQLLAPFKVGAAVNP